MEDKKILFLIGSSEIGGTEKMVLSIVENIKKFGFCPVVVGLRGKGEFLKVLESKNIKFHVVNLKKNPLSFIKLLKILKKERVDILQSFLYAGNIIGRISGKLVGIPVVVSGQRSTDDWRRWYHWKIDLFTLKWCDAIISNSYAGKKVLMEKGIPAEKIYVIPNGIEVGKQFRKIKKEEIGINENDPVVGCVGNLRKPKGHIYLIKSAARILKIYPETKFVILGKGKLERYLKKEVKRRTLDKNFFFLGFVPEPEKIMNIFDIFVLPSLWEGFPVSLLEAMSLKKAIVATQVGDIPLIIRDGEEGILVSPYDQESLASAIITLLKDEKLRKKMGEKAYEKVKNYTVGKMVERYAVFYNKLLNLQRGNSGVK